MIDGSFDDSLPDLNQRIRMSDGVELQVARFRPATGFVRGTILSLHGIQSHSGWYGRSSRRLADEGWEVWFLDRRGAGRSAGLRGHAPHWTRLVHDVRSVLQIVRLQTAGPVFLQAVSWGGRLAAVVAECCPRLLDGLVLLYPGIYAHVRPSLRERLLLGLADLLGVRRKPVVIPLTDASLFTDDPGWQSFLNEDPLALRTVTTGFVLASEELARRSQAAGPRIHCPAFLALAGRDRIVDSPAVRRWLQTLATPDKRLIEFPEAAHTLEFAPSFEAYVSALLEWLAAHEKARGVDSPGLQSGQ